MFKKKYGNYIPNYVFDEETQDYMSYDYLCLNCNNTFKEENVNYCPKCGVKLEELKHNKR